MMARQKPDLAASAWRKGARVLALGAVLAPLLVGCTVTQPTSIISTTGQIPQGNAVQLPSIETDGSLRATFGRALDAAMAAQSIEITDDASVVAAYAVAVREARTGVADPAASTEEEVIWESQPRPGGIFDICDAQRLRGTLVLLDRASGEVVYRGVGESTSCEFDEAELVTLAEVLVADASGAVASD